MLRKPKSRFLSGKNIFTIVISTIALITITNAQGITMTLGGNTSADKFIVENSDSEAGLVVTGEGNVGIGTTNPVHKLSVVGSNSSATIYGETTKDYGRGVYGMASGSSGDGVYGKTWGSSGCGVWGEAANTGVASNYGGYFNAKGSSGRGVCGVASNSGDVTNYGGYFIAQGKSGSAIYAIADNLSGTNYGGKFAAFGESGCGIRGNVSGSSGQGVRGEASNSGNVTNYGGYFISQGESGYGVYGKANNSSGITNYGGYFKSAGILGHGVHGKATGGAGYGVCGEATGSNGVGVFGQASNNGTVTNYGGWFSAKGSSGRGVYGEVIGSYGYGVYGRSLGTNGKGIVGSGTAYDFYAEGSGTNYGSSSSIRWKRNIVKIDNPLEKLAELRGVYFDWDEEHGGQHDVGCIAEEVGKVLPEIVNYEKNGIDADGMDYSKLTPLLIEAIKALQKRVEELENR